MRDAARGRARPDGAQRLRAVGDRRPGRRRRVPGGPRRPARAGGPLPASRSSTPRPARRVPDGSDGELVFTTLTKEALPLLRYRTGDIAIADARALRLRADVRAHERGPRPPRRHADHPRRQPLPVPDRARPARRRTASRRTTSSSSSGPTQLDELTSSASRPSADADTTARRARPATRSASGSAWASRRGPRARRGPAQRGQGRARHRPRASGSGSSVGRLAVRPSPEERRAGGG